MSNHDFGAAAGSDTGKRMSTYTLEDGDLCRIIRKADVMWRSKQPGDTLFGETHWDRNPSAWSFQFLATRYTWAFAQLIIWSQHRNNQFLRGVEFSSNNPLSVITQQTNRTVGRS
eukprot:13968527-Ditylum_brightwellii.AAC.1